MYTISDIKKLIEKARDAGACEEEIVNISCLETAEEVYAHPSAAYWAYWYANYVLEDRFIEGEALIKTDKRWACWYAKNVLKSRWSEAEGVIRESPEWACWYSKNIIQARWIEAEGVIKTSPEWAYRYALDVIQARWIEGEVTIKTDPVCYSFYKACFGTDL